MNIPENFDRWMFDYKEGNLSGSEMESFENFLIQNPDYEVEADAWSQAFVENEDIPYPNQAALEKDRKVVPIYMWSTAALLLLLIGVGSVLVMNTGSTEINGLASDKEWKNNSSNQNLLSSDNFTLKNNVLNSLNEHNQNENLTSSANWVNTVYLSNGNNSNSNPNVQNSNLINSGNDQFASNDTEYIIGSNDNEAYSESMAFDQEIDKLGQDNHSATYQSNPELNDLGFDVNKNKSKNSYNTFGKSVKRFYKKIEKMLDYPVGLTNLRDPNLGLAQNSLIMNNPGFTGGMLASRFEMNYRNQWLGSDMNSQELTMSFDNYSYQMRGGVGIIVNAKDYGMGAYGDYNVSLLYSPKFVINRNVVFEPAVKLTLGALTANGNKLNSNSSVELERGRLLNTVDAGQMSGTQQLWYKDYGLGFVLNTKWFYAGFSADNLANHYENVFLDDQITPTASPVHLNGVIGFDYESERSKNSMKVNRSLSPYLAYNQIGERKDLWAGCNFRLDWFTIGGSYSTNHDYTANVGMQFEKFKMIYRYDMTESAFLGEQIGSHSIGIRFNSTRKKARIH